jgi:glycosyltransferase involved in cell wall biosynthesis
MDCSLPKDGRSVLKITYWTTSCLEPHIEAVSKEVFELSNHFKDSLLFAVSPHLTIRWSHPNRYVGFNSRLDPFLRYLIPLVEKRTEINHVYSEVSPWVFYKTLKTKPTVLTIASEKGPPVVEFLERCRGIVAQTENMKKRLLGYGIEEDRIHVVYPGVDLSVFTPHGPRRECRRPKILFATAPRTEEELAGRGVKFMIEVAKYFPEIDLRLMFRPWRSGHSSLSKTIESIKELGLSNVMITDGFEKHVDATYRDNHFTVIPYTLPEGGKECPRSLIESLACGVPILISEVAPFSRFVSEHRCGEIFPLTPHGFGLALERGLRDYTRLSENAAACSKKHFDREETFKAYEGIYRSII